MSSRAAPSAEVGTLTLNDGGIGVATFPEGAQNVMVRAADGTVLDEVPIFIIQ